MKKLMETLCDLKAMESEARRLDYDFKRIPLGKITKEQIKSGYEALTRIEKHINGGNFGKSFVEANNKSVGRDGRGEGCRFLGITQGSLIILACALLP